MEATSPSTRTIIAISIAGAIALLACSTGTEPMGIPAPKVAQQRDPAAESGWQPRGEIEREALRRFGERPLEDASFSSGVSYRLILYPTFHRPILVQARMDGGVPGLKTKTLSGVGGYGIGELGKLAVNEQRPLSSSEWQRFEVYIDDSEFWTEPRIDTHDEPVEDGNVWSLHARRPDLFHRIDRITPSRKELALFRYLLKLSSHEEDYVAYLPDDN
jgi:hypothetical protein